MNLQWGELANFFLEAGAPYYEHGVERVANLKANQDVYISTVDSADS